MTCWASSQSPFCILVHPAKRSIVLVVHAVITVQDSACIAAVKQAAENLISAAPAPCVLGSLCGDQSHFAERGL